MTLGIYRLEFFIVSIQSSFVILVQFRERLADKDPPVLQYLADGSHTARHFLQTKLCVQKIPPGSVSPPCTVWCQGFFAVFASVPLRIMQITSNLIGEI